MRSIDGSADSKSPMLSKALAPRGLETEPVAQVGFFDEAVEAGRVFGADAGHFSAHFCGLAAVVEVCAVVKTHAVVRVHQAQSTSSVKLRPHSRHSSSNMNGTVMMVGPPSKLKPSGLRT